MTQFTAQPLCCGSERPDEPTGSDQKAGRPRESSPPEAALVLAAFPDVSARFLCPFSLNHRRH